MLMSQTLLFVQAAVFSLLSKRKEQEIVLETRGSGTGGKKRSGGKRRSPEFNRCEPAHAACLHEATSNPYSMFLIHDQP